MVAMSFENDWSPGLVRLADGSVEEEKVAEFTVGARQFDALPRLGRQAIRQSLQENEVVRWLERPLERAKFYFAIFFAVLCLGTMAFHSAGKGELILFAILTVTGLIIVFLFDRKQVYVVTNKRLLGVSYAWIRRRDPVDTAVPLTDIVATRVTGNGVEVTTAKTKLQLIMLSDPQEAERQIQLAKRRAREG
jgi:hypothetical protein